MAKVIFIHTEKKYKQAFHKHDDKLFRLYQTKPIVIDGESYVMVGHTKLQGYPLISHYDIFDNHCSSANEQIAENVHHFLSILQLTEIVVRKLEKPFHQFIDHVDEVDLNFDDVKTSNLTKSLSDIREKMGALLQLSDSLLAKNSWNVDDMNELNVVWDAFWRVYEQRVGVLLSLYIQQQKSSQDHSFNEINDEMTIIGDYYKVLTPMGARMGCFTMEDFISHNEKHGRLQQDDAPFKKRHKLERGVFTFLTYFLRFMVWIITPLILLGSGFNYFALMPLLIFILMAYVIKSQNKQHLLDKVNTDFAELRAMPISNKEHSSMLKTYNTYTVLLHYLYFSILFLVVYIVVLGYKFSIGEIDPDDLNLFILLGISLAIFTVLFPFTPLGKKKLSITHMAIHVGKRRLGALEIVKVVIKKNDIEIFVNYSDNPFRLRVPKADQQQAKNRLKTFCELHYIPVE